MKLFLRPFGGRALGLAQVLALSTWFGVGAVGGADAILPVSNDGALPQPVNQNTFEAILKNSPFTRSLGDFDSIILTGIARTDTHVFATLLNTDTHQSHLVSEKANAQGWQLVGVGGDETHVETLIAKIQIAGGEVISVRYQEPPPRPAVVRSGGPSRGSGSGSGSGSGPLRESQLSEARRAAENYREGFSGDGYPREPPPEIVQKLSRISVEQREAINRQMLGLRNQGLGMDERRKIYVETVDRAAQGRR